MRCLMVYFWGAGVDNVKDFAEEKQGGECLEKEVTNPQSCFTLPRRYQSIQPALGPVHGAGLGELRCSTWC